MHMRGMPLSRDGRRGRLAQCLLSLMEILYDSIIPEE
jgi:hypothetical protein